MIQGTIDELYWAHRRVKLAECIFYAIYFTPGVDVDEARQAKDQVVEECKPILEPFQ